MALQGTIDTFPLTDVLALLASSSRSGRLRMSGDRGSGTMWIHDQAVLGGELEDGRVVAPQRIAFELLRFEDGSFEFESVERTEFPDFESVAILVDECVVAAHSMIEEWSAIEAVVPSIQHRVELAAELPTPEFTIDRALWRVLVTTARCGSVAELSEALGVDDYEGSALVASMVREGIVEIGEPMDLDEFVAQPTEDEDASDSADVPPVEVAVTQADGATDGAFPDHFPIDDLIGEDGTQSESPWNSEEKPATDDDSGDSAWGEQTAEGAAFDGWDELVDSHGAEIGAAADDATEEVLRQMSKLSPKAAEAIAAALGSTDSSASEETADASAPSGDPAPISFLDSF